MKGMEVLLGITVVMDQFLGTMALPFIQIVTQTHILIQVSHSPTTTQQGKGTASSQATKAVEISKSKRSRSSG